MDALWLVGATGFEPVTSSVSAKHRKPLCSTPFSQVAANRSAEGKRSVDVQGNALFHNSSSACTGRSLHLQRVIDHCMRAFTCIHRPALISTGDLVVRVGQRREAR
jgi:hypothetical protein